jgi:acetyl esterase/lipase
MRFKSKPIKSKPIGIGKPSVQTMCLPVALSTICMLNFSSLAWAAKSEEQPVEPPQPTNGPGGSAATNNAVLAHKYDAGDLEYWLFEPASPTPQSAPVVIFNHGWSAMTPAVYLAWIEHIVKRGNIVIFPRYQASLRTPPATFAPNAISAVKSGLKRLQTENGHVRPQIDKIAAVGHSAGGQVSASMGALAATSGLPPIAAIMCVQPGKSWGSKTGQIPLADMSKVPKDTLLLAIASDRDEIAKDIDAKRIFSETRNVPPANKNFVMLLSDDHGSPALIASHFFPVATATGDSALSRQVKGSGNQAPMGPFAQMIRERIAKRLGEIENVKQQSAISFAKGKRTTVNALDYFGTWKLFDGLTNAAFYGRDREYALGNTPQQRFMGKWSDGVPVKEMIVKAPPSPKSKIQ